MIVYLTNHHRTCHPERSRKAAKSKDLRTEILLSTTVMRRFFDFAALCAASLRMTRVLGFCCAKRSFTAAVTNRARHNDKQKSWCELGAAARRETIIYLYGESFF